MRACALLRPAIALQALGVERAAVTRLRRQLDVTLRERELAAGEHVVAHLVVLGVHGHAEARHGAQVEARRLGVVAERREHGGAERLLQAQLRVAVDLQVQAHEARHLEQAPEPEHAQPDVGHGDVDRVVALHQVPVELPGVGAARDAGGLDDRRRPPVAGDRQRRVAAQLLELAEVVLALEAARPLRHGLAGVEAVGQQRRDRLLDVGDAIRLQRAHHAPRLDRVPGAVRIHADVDLGRDRLADARHERHVVVGLVARHRELERREALGDLLLRELPASSRT